MQSPEALEKQLRENLEKTMGELLPSNDEQLDVTDPVLPNVAVSIKLKWAY